jgi:glucokinase
MKNEKLSIGVDIGGTRIRTGAITPQGKVIGTSLSTATIATDNKEVIVNRIIDLITSVIEQNHLDKSNIQKIGLGVTGPLDCKNGIILQCPSLPTMDFFPLRDAINKAFSIPVFMNNDANAMILGESIWGAGRGYQCVLGFTLGTGLGCAVVIDGKILMGSTESAGEIWISPYKDGIIEDVVSGNGISKLYENLSGIKISAAEITTKAFSGDTVARSVWDEFGKAVAFALAWSINLINPDIVIIGGSISNAMELFLPSLKETVCKNLCPVPAQNLLVVKAQLGDNAGFIGAAALTC